MEGKPAEQENGDMKARAAMMSEPWVELPGRDSPWSRCSADVSMDGAQPSHWALTI